MLAAEGATVVVHGRDPVQAERVAQDIVTAGHRAHCVLGDLTREEDVQRLVEDAQRLAGRIDILVNNAGGSGGVNEQWSDSQPARWMSSYDRNVLAAVRVTTRVLPAMRQAGWGRVINISSLAALMPPPSRPEYAASKAAMNAMTSSLAKAVAGEGVTVNAVSPGTAHSEALERRFREVAQEEGLASDAPWADIERAVLPRFAQIPVGRVGQLREIASTVAFLASGSAAYITGSNLRVDGGMLPGI
jgi:NAD(P)-dependent dehydrogenase (short-subunit alcohol dehydrogenase family)